MVRRILVTGGAGYVGSRLIPHLLQNGHDVRVLDSMIYGDEGLATVKDNVEIIAGDIRDESTVNRAMDGVDSVIHLAAISNDPSSDLNPQLTREVNLFGHKLLVRTAKNKGVNRFIFASSSSVYGIKEEEQVTEDLPLEPITLYSQSKVMGENFLNSQTSPDFSTTIVRPATICGFSPRQRLDVVVNIFTYSALKNGVITVNGGNQKRPNIHIQDMVEVYSALLMADRGKISGKVYNFGGDNHTLMQLAEIVRNSLKSVKADIQAKPYTKDSRSYSISSERIRGDLGLEAKRTIESAVAELEQALLDGRVKNPESNRYRNVKRIMEIGADKLLYHHETG